MLVNWGRLSVSIGENGLHWTLDVTFKDDCRVRTGHAPQNLAILDELPLIL